MIWSWKKDLVETRSSKACWQSLIRDEEWCSAQMRRTLRGVSPMTMSSGFSLLQSYVVICDSLQLDLALSYKFLELLALVLIQCVWGATTSKRFSWTYDWWQCDGLLRTASGEKMMYVVWRMEQMMRASIFISFKELGICQCSTISIHVTTKLQWFLGRRTDVQYCTVLFEVKKM